VAISLGNGRVVEAANPRSGVRESNAGDRFEFAAIIPGISDGTATPIANPVTTPLSELVPATTPVAQPLVELGGPDTDLDGLSDALERRQGLDPQRADTDGDNLSDGQEMVTFRTDGRKADSDGDGLNDAFELAQGLDPRSPDSDADGHLDGALTPLQQVDSDRDGLDDALEGVLGFNVQAADSDKDGFSDALEFRSGANAMNLQDNPLLHEPGATNTLAPANSLGTNPLGATTLGAPGATGAIGIAQVPGSQVPDATDLP
jgi:hypothetical protein